VLGLFIVTGAVASVVAWLAAGGPPWRLVVEQRPVLGALIATIVYAEYAAVLGAPTSPWWSLVAAACTGAGSGLSIAMTLRIGHEVLRTRSGEPPMMHASDIVDRRMVNVLLPLVVVIVLARAVLFFVGFCGR
jgi:hypothetical protein